MFSKCLENVRSKAPLVHCITNYVTVERCCQCDSCQVQVPLWRTIHAKRVISLLYVTACVNIGTPNSMTIEVMRVACARAQALKHPMVLDPVGAGASRLRTDTAREASG